MNTVLYNGTIHTLDPQNPTVDAIAISGDQIAAVGTGDDLCTLLGPNGRGIDLDGKTVIPGFVDAHLHFAGYSLRLDQVHIHELPTKEETLSRVKDRVLQSGPNKWLRGGGWNCRARQPGCAVVQGWTFGMDQYPGHAGSRDRRQHP